MAVLQMQRINICALRKDRKQILESLQRMGVVEVSDQTSQDAVFHKVDVETQQDILEKQLSRVNEAQRILNERVPKKKSLTETLNGRTIIETNDYTKLYETNDEALHVAKKIITLDKTIAETKAEILKLQAVIEMIKPWEGFDLSFDFKGTKTTVAFIGTLPSEWTLDALREVLVDIDSVDISIVSASKIQTNIFVLALKQDEQRVGELLRGIGFSYPSLQISKPPAKYKEEVFAKIDKQNQMLEESVQQLEDLSKQRQLLQWTQDYLKMRCDKYEVITKLQHSKSSFLLSGFIPEQNIAVVEKEIGEHFDVVIDFQKPDENEDVPVALKNNGFATPLEGTLQSFSLPGKGEMDPTMPMAIFYYVLFGLMLSDAVYGLIMVLACGGVLLKFNKKLEEGTKNAAKMFFYCGVSTTFWGVMFGSYLGDIVNVVSETFFGKLVYIKPLWFEPVKDPMRMLVFSMALGLIHLFSGLALKAYQYIKNKDYLGVVYDCLFWYMLLIGSVGALMSVSMFTDTLGVDFILSKNVGSIMGVIALIGAIGITLTNGRESKNPFKRFLKGLYALYGITGYLSDVLSYSRLLALGLATGVISTVINKMAAMTAKGAIGVVLFIIIIIFGHTLNIAINALGAYVHTTRLQYVEFFGKFYEGGGRAFEPFRANTKYFKFKENK